MLPSLITTIDTTPSPSIVTNNHPFSPPLSFTAPIISPPTSPDYTFVPIPVAQSNSGFSWSEGGLAGHIEGVNRSLKPAPMASRNRRVSLPAFSVTSNLLKQQTSLTEARGMVSDMLSWDTLPPHVLTGLRAINGLLSQHNISSLSESSTLPRIAEDPLTGEQIYINSRSSPSARLSPVVWSTVTSATGLPTVEPEPSRSRSSSFWKRHRGSSLEEENGPLLPTFDGSTDTDTLFTVPDGTKFNVTELNEDSLLCRIGELDFPVFELAQKSPKTCLTKTSYRIFSERNLFTIFKIPMRKFFCFFHNLELGYLDIPYHNRIHASDVSQLLYYLFSNQLPAISESHSVNSDSKDQSTICSMLSSLEIMALFTAAAMHDYDHPGRTNAFLVTARDPKAVLYNDRSVLENHHAASSWKVLTEQENFWIECLDEAEYRKFRYLVIEAILSTDLKRHFDILAEFNNKVADGGDMLDWESEADRLLVCQMCIKLADISSPTRDELCHRQWTERIVEEFYQQGDEEVKRGYPISAYMDRKNPQLARLQDSFITHLVSPLADAMALSGLLPEDDETGEAHVIQNLRSNREIWLAELEKLGKSPSGSSDMSVIRETDETDNTTNGDTQL